MQRLDTEALALAWLKNRIEALSEIAPMWSKSAYTHSRTTHTVFANGAIKPEGEPAAQPSSDVCDLAELTLGAVRAHRATIQGPVLLTWRCEPEIHTSEDGAKQVYCRLCLEPDYFAPAGYLYALGSNPA